MTYFRFNFVFIQQLYFCIFINIQLMGTKIYKYKSTVHVYYYISYNRDRLATLKKETILS